MDLVLGQVLPDLIFFVKLIQIRGQHQTEVQSHELIIGPGHGLGGDSGLLALHELVDHTLQLRRVPHAQGVGHVVREHMGVAQDHDHLVVMFRPPARQDLVLLVEQLPVVHHFVEHVAVHIGGHGGGAGQVREEGCGVDLGDALGGVGGVDQRRDAVAVVEVVDGVLHLVIVEIQMLFEGAQIVAAHLTYDLGDHLRFLDHALIGVLGVHDLGTDGHEGRGDIRRVRLDGQGIVGKGVLLDLVDIGLEARGKSQDQGDADDADGACKGRQQCSGLLGQQVIEAQAEGGENGHGTVAHVFMGGLHGLTGDEGIGVVDDPAVLDPDDAIGVLLRQLRVVGDHDHQPVPGDFFQ